ncbi:MAG: DedA family protein [Sphaerospermopsis kisseleviana]
MLEWITKTISSLGYLGITLLMFLENLFPPIPSELIMPLAGFTSGPYQPGGAKLNIIGVFLSGLLGSVAGALICYYPGKFLGERRLKQLANKYGRWLTISSEDIDRAKGWFNRHGGKAVLIGRIVPGIRTLISVPAGMSNMPLLPFLFYTTLGSAAWVALLTYSRYWLGIQYELVQKYLAPVSKIVLGGLLVVFLLWVLKRQSRETRR